MKNKIKNRVFWSTGCRNLLLCLLMIAPLFFFSGKMYANLLPIDHRYQRSFFSIQNNTAYPLSLVVVGVDGTWVTPVFIKSPIILAPKQSYENTLISLKTRHGLKNFVSFDIAQFNNERENYLIFSESASSRKHYLSAHIFDGLGPIFVCSDTNHCDRDTIDGYAYCELKIRYC